MKTIEDRLREAFRTDAETVRPETVRPFASPGAERRRPVRKPPARIMVPIAAAAAVAVIAVGTAVVLPRILGSRDHHAPPSGLAAGYPDGRMPSGPPPKFFVAITHRPGTSELATNLSVINAVTGRITGRLLAPPGASRFFQAVVPLGNDRTFVAAASAPGCDTRFYTFKLTGQGKPMGLTPLAVPVVPGQPQLGALAASSDGTVIGYDTHKCSNRNIEKYLGQVGLISLASRHVTTWSYRWPAIPASLSLSAEGRILEMVNNPSDGSRGLDVEHNAAWVVRTGSAAGPLALRYRKVIGPPTWPTAAVLSPTGKLTWALLPSYVRGTARWKVTLAVYDTATGELFRTWHIFPQQGYLSGPSLSASVSGRYLLVFQFNNGVEKLDLATGKLTKVPGNNAYLPTDVAW